METRKMLLFFCVLITVGLFVYACVLNMECRRIKNQVEEIVEEYEELTSVQRKEVIPEEPQAMVESELPDIYSLSCMQFKPFEGINLPSDVQEHLVHECSKYQLNVCLMLALLESESSCIADAKGDWTEDGYGNRTFRSYGYMQINRINWDRMEDDYDLDIFDPYDNITAGIIIFKEYEGDTVAETIMNYKCGPSRARELMSQGIELKCVENIVNRAQELQELNSNAY